jgi:hypothetical protein
MEFQSNRFKASPRQTVIVDPKDKKTLCLGDLGEAAASDA